MPNGNSIQRYVHITMGAGHGNGNYSLSVASSTALSSPYTWSWNGTDIGDFVAPDETVDVEWRFTSEWAGSIVEVVDAQGNVIATYGLPAVIGPEGYTIEATISAPDLEGAQVYLDGVPTNSLASLAASELVTEDVDRPGYAFGFDSTYSGYEWEIRRPDGTVAANGSAATFGTVAEGRVTIGGDESGQVYVRSPGGDGIASSWIPTGVLIAGQGTTTHLFTQSDVPELEPVTALPEIPDLPAAPVASTNVPSTTTATNSFASDQVVNVEVEPAEVPSTDVGQEGVVAKAQEINEKMADAYSHIYESFNNIGLTFSEFRKIVLGAPGINCTFTMGGAQVDISTYVPGWIRTASKLVFLFGAIAAIKQMLWDTFH